MRRSQSVIIALFFGMLVSACASNLTKDIEVLAKSRPNVDFSAYKTYAWMETAEIVNDPAGQWEPPQFDADAEVKRLVNGELHQRGMTEVNSNPELLVTFVAGIDMQSLELREDPEDKKLETLQNIPKGALVVVLADAEARVPVWAGVATADVGQQTSSDAVRKRLDYAITEMFKGLPGGSNPGSSSGY